MIQEEEVEEEEEEEKYVGEKSDAFSIYRLLSICSVRFTLLPAAESINVRHARNILRTASIARESVA